MVVLGVAALVVGGGTGAYVTKNVTSEPEPATVTRAKTVTVPAEEPITEAQAPSPATVGLSELEEEEDVESLGYVENRYVGRQSYADAVMVEVFPDQPEQVAILTKGRFSTMHFVVGIDAEAICPRSKATVSIEDQDGRTMWGPRTATISKPITETISIASPLQVYLVQHTKETDRSCEGGWTQVSWGDVTFQS
jgi:hypothetical protein